MNTGFIWHELYMWHDTQNYAGVLQPGLELQPGNHFESPESKRRIKSLLDVAGLSDSLEFIVPKPANKYQLLGVHTAEYLAHVESLNESGGDAGGLTPFGPGSVEIAKLSAGGVVALTEAIQSGLVENGYSLNRPPGHHALPDSGCGFCIFNNVAIAAQNLIEQHGLDRIAIVDIDVHHGNGAETIFYDRADVLTISVHQDNCFPPDSGMQERIGQGKGKGYNINIPLPPGTGMGGYELTFDEVIVPALHKFKPDFILVPCGFDAGGQDPLGRMLLSSNTYRRLAQNLKGAAADLCDGKIAFCHEGGYNPNTVPYMALAVIETLLGISAVMQDPFAELIDAMGYQSAQDHQSRVIQQVAKNLHYLDAQN